MNCLRHLFLALTTFFALSGAALALENDSLEVSYFQDSSHQISVEELVHENFTPISTNFALGFTKKTTWLKIEARIHPESGQFYLSVWPPRLENIELFALSNSDNQITEVHAIPESNRMRDAFYDSFKRKVFDLQAFRHSHTFYLKIVTDNALTGGLTLLTKENIEAHRANEGFLLGGVTFGLVPFLLIFFALATYKKQPIYVVYFFSLLTTTLLYLSIYGFDWIKIIFKLDIPLDHQVGLLGIVNIYFSYTFLSYICQLLGTPLKITDNLRRVLLVCLVLIPAYVWLERRIVLEVFYVIFFLISLIIEYCIIRYFDKKSMLQWLIAILFSAITIGAARVFLTMLGIVDTSENVFLSQSLRIVTIPFALLVLVGYFELENNKYVLNLLLEKTLSEQNKKTELERRKIYESFMSMLVHEIKTPLSVIQIAAASLSRHLEQNTAETNRINNIKKSVTEINQIFNKCIQVIDIENGSVALEASEFSIDFLIEDIERTVANPKLRCQVLERIKVHSDFVLLKTVLINLISNGLKYGKEDQGVKLDIASVPMGMNHSVRFTVTNEIGPVGAPDTEKIFTRYYRSESAKKFTGSGLGLWLSQELAKILGGVITIERDDVFVRFSFSIPGGRLNG